MTANDSDMYDVIVAGAGPVGLALARLMTMQGHSVAVVDPNRLVCPFPRATHVDDETMRTFQTLGYADMVSRFLTQKSWKLVADGKVFLEFFMPEGTSDQGWGADCQFYQPDFESRLRGLLYAAGATLLLGMTVDSFEEDENGVTATVSGGNSAGTSTIRGRYLVGADGAHSPTRHRLGIDFEELFGTQRSLIVDLHPFDHPDSLPTADGFVRCDGERPLTYVPTFPPKLRFEFMLRPDDDRAEWERPSTIYRLLSEYLTPGSYRIQRTDVYEWHARLATQWRRGRVLLAGDAAHLMPPMLGQGMCSGLRDSMNLAWKLSAVLRGAPDALLDTYATERAAHVRPYIVESARQSNMIEAFADPANRPPTGTPSETLVRARPLLGPGLSDEPGGAIGQLSPQPLLEDGTRTDDTVGYRFAIAAAPETLAGVADSTREVWSQIGAVVLEPLPEAMAAYLDANGVTAAIIRPDRYCYAACAGSTDLDAATDALAPQMLASDLVS